MTWAKLDDRLYDDPRTEAAGVEAMGLFAIALSYMGAYHTDGWITLERVRRLAGRRGRWFAEKLVAAGWWEKPEGTVDTYRLIGWERYILPATEVADRSERAAAAGRKGGTRRAERARTSTETPPEPPPKVRDDLPGSGEVQGEVPSDKAAKAKGSRQATRAPDPDPTRPDRAHARTRGDQRDPVLFEEALPTPKAKASDRYLEAFVAGLADEGHRITPPKASEGALLGRIAATHARTGDKPITGDALLVWIRATTRRFRKAITRPEVHRGGISVFGLQTWLDNGAQAQPGGPRADVDDDEEINPDEWERPPGPLDDDERPPPFKLPTPPKTSPEELQRTLAWAREKGMIPPAKEAARG